MNSVLIYKLVCICKRKANSNWDVAISQIFHVPYLIFSNPQHELYEERVIITPILQMRKIENQRNEVPCAKYTTSNKQSVILTPIADVLPYTIAAHLRHI